MPIPYPQQTPSSSSSSSSSSDASSDFDEEEQAAMIQEEWEESLRQLEVVFSIVVIPFFGKWYGRRFGFWCMSCCHRL
jgi:hypothetical protein